jgi:hypothetical protein
LWHLLYSAEDDEKESDEQIWLQENHIPLLNINLQADYGSFRTKQLKNITTFNGSYL